MFYWYIPCQEASETTSVELLVSRENKQYSCDSLNLEIDF
ncbi:hypothetical protein J663_0261 [Acinetobacter sp. 826659]|nr:hypothetical protein J663_0261 [Acinetobacter sp. 826659]